MLVAVGRTTTKFLEEGIAEYCRRLIRYIPFEIKYIGDIRNTRNLNATQQKQKEGDAILSMLAPQDYVVLLDEHGRELTSRDFAAYIETVGVYNWRALRLFGRCCGSCQRKDFPLKNDILS